MHEPPGAHTWHQYFWCGTCCLGVFHSRVSPGSPSPPEFSSRTAVDTEPRACRRLPPGICASTKQGLGSCRSFAALFVPALEPYRKYQISVLPAGPAVFSAAFFGGQPLATRQDGEADVLRFTTKGVPGLFRTLRTQVDRPFLAIEKAVCPTLAVSLSLEG